MPYQQPSLVRLPVMEEPRGDLAIIEGGVHIPFAIGRVYYIYKIPGGAARGGHAHRTLQQLVVALAGSFDVHIDNGTSTVTYHLDRAHTGLLIPPMHWRTLDSFTEGSVCLVVASDGYDEADYIRDPDEFSREAGGRTAP